ncbi:bactofilin family protein [Aquisalimonas asiatica]|uniref:Protein CcmA, bactofilin family n=1 Tax=Aquisalimonas asiatica TaxID=406100 RepID=A0A1H8VG30_9GAMM|nr:polymer-forming cytoskeletal protein [Aquisalimonas asiatica]SEP14422.1 protein CcmA, bactofilin family [Aquisalimonas asiatica]
MGLFGKSGKETRRRGGGTTIIATGTTLVGELKPEGNLHIDGRIEGNIRSEHDVSIGADGSFEGDIQAHRMVVSGFARGRIECDSLEIVEQGKVLGEVSSRAFVIEPGGQFLGESRSTDEEAVAALSHWKQSTASGGEPTEQAGVVVPEPEPAKEAEPEPAVDIKPTPEPEVGSPVADADTAGEPDIGPAFEDERQPGAGDEAADAGRAQDREDPRQGRDWVAQGERRWR